MRTAKAKFFWSGRPQAVRLPKEFRIADDVAEVEIHRKGNLLILELPAQEARFTDEWAWLENLEPLDPDVIAAADDDEGAFEDRPERDALFQ